VLLLLRPGGVLGSIVAPAQDVPDLVEEALLFRGRRGRRGLGVGPGEGVADFVKDVGGFGGCGWRRGRGGGPFEDVPDLVEEAFLFGFGSGSGMMRRSRRCVVRDLQVLDKIHIYFLGVLRSKVEDER